MARVIYVPKWLKESIGCDNETLHKMLYENPISDLLVNSHDQANYVRAQLDFAKFIVTRLPDSEDDTSEPSDSEIRKVLVNNSKAKEILFKDNWPLNNPEVNYAIKSSAEIPRFELLHLDLNATCPYAMQFEYHAMHLAPVIFVHGECVPSNAELSWQEKRRKYAFPMKSILHAAYKQQNIQLGQFDHSNFVNQNETLFSLYVSSISCT